MNWNKLWEGISYELLCGKEKKRISGICCHSGKASRGSVFVCIKGTGTDASLYTEEAYQRGCRVFVTDRPFSLKELPDKKKKNCTVVLVSDSRTAYSLLCRNWFERADENLIMIGITGTKGKTTTSYLLEKQLKKAGISVGVIGTCGARWCEKEKALLHTTPDAYVLHETLREMVRDGVTHAVMEVSSQALMMKRVSGITFEVAAFTNLSSDHIGEKEHATAEEYFYWKSRLFAMCRKAVLPCYGEYGKRLYADMEKRSVPCYIVGIQEEQSWTLKDESHLLLAKDIEMKFRQHTPIVHFWLKSPEYKKELSVTLGMAGGFNVSNLLTAFAVCDALEIPLKEVKDACRSVKIHGRMELAASYDGICVFIDYAHNEESLRSCLTSLKEYHPKRLICVFGCGGNRSKLRRYQMGEVSGKLADLTIVTEDNSRWESVEEITADIVTGLKKTNGAYKVIYDRQDAIQKVLQQAVSGDMIVIAGKGHETYMEKEGVRTYFSDMEEVVKYGKVRKYHSRHID